MLQPDQDPELWNLFARPYETVFEPLTDQFVAHALQALSPLRGARLLDICAGAGGAALMAAAAGAHVTAIDASPAMVARIESRAVERADGSIATRVMDAAALDLPAASFDGALSCFGVVLLPDPGAALGEIARILRPGARLALITWTEPQSYELAARLRRAAEAQGFGAPPQGPTPAQLRYAEPASLTALLTDAGYEVLELRRMTGALRAPSAEWLGDHLGFAPGLAAMLDSFGGRRGAVVESFLRRLTADQGPGPVSLSAVAHMAVASTPA